MAWLSKRPTPSLAFSKHLLGGKPRSQMQENAFSPTEEEVSLASGGAIRCQVELCYNLCGDNAEMGNILDVLNYYSNLITSAATVILSIITIFLWFENRILRKAGFSPEVVAHLATCSDGSGADVFRWLWCSRVYFSKRWAGTCI